MIEIDKCLKNSLWKIRAGVSGCENPESSLTKLFQSRILNLVLAQSENFDKVIGMLEDAESIRLYTRDIEYRLLSCVFSRDIVLLLLEDKFIDTKQYYKMLMDVETDTKYIGIEYPHYGIQLFVLDNYQIDGICSIQEGDTVFDIGAFDGLTAIKFAKLAGENGKVYAVEANPNQADSLKKELNSYQNITVCKTAFYDKKCVLHISDNKSSSSISNTGLAIDAIPLDAFVEDNKIESVDYIKMDIEGAELKALLGAEKTIRKHLPRMAICIYHNAGKDLLAIPLFFDKLGLNYKYYVRKYYMTESETVLFCVPQVST